MKVMQPFYILALTLIIFSCNEAVKTKNTPSIPVSEPIVLEEIYQPVKLQKLQKFFVVGDFDGDGIKDTIFEHNFSRLTGKEIDSSASPYEMIWDSVEAWFYKQDAISYLTLNKKNKNKDTLFLGTAQGLYCLINVGDNNGDGRDEIAFVIDYLDYSRVNTCQIYSLCKNKWTLMQEFGVHEDAFDYQTPEVPVYKDIKEYLEKRKGKWFYMDYSNNETFDPDFPMLPLKPPRCK